MYVNSGFTRSIDGLAALEIDLLLKDLFSRVYLQEHNLRVVWQLGTITVWDNQRTQQYIVQDSSYRRTMHRVIVTPAER